ncbi:pantoate--beta-alanine ligase [Crocinitomix catalasitica]|uniref:pantoate--beta-alanine ligase n=1 Tax=Crocinitomix catalasitica TaxID=184607 RepID=UPI000485BF39|nr:pantoate--beta-alanine ligase [Crocinitomix catalasitica]
MKIVKNLGEINALISSIRSSDPAKKIGFVPTMGALHEGHLSLINAAQAVCDIVICNIFVNPTQFNNPSDLATYPRTIAEDTEKLESVNCDVLIIPDVDSVYPNGVNSGYTIDLEGIDQVLEGKFRPGHFNGVCMVVERLFEMVGPNKAFFGEKDFQQLAIIRKMVEIRKIDVEVIGVLIQRNKNGLALSSRNALLSEEQLKDAEIIYQSLLAGVLHAVKSNSSLHITEEILRTFKKGNLELEYVEIVDSTTLLSVDVVDNNSRICMAAYCGSVRLIDNMGLNLPIK